MLTDQVGDGVYIRGAANGFYKVARADPQNLVKMPVLGVIVKKWDYTSALVQTFGEVKNIYVGLEPGKQYVVGADSRPARFMSLSPPSGVSYLTQPLGQAIDTGVLFLRPSQITTVKMGN
jgi:hypothetical protein